MKRDIKKNKRNPSDDLDDEDELEVLDRKVASITLGDINVSSSKSNLVQCQQVLKNIVMDKSLRNYLNDFSKRKILPSYVG